MSASQKRGPKAVRGKDFNSMNDDELKNKTKTRNKPTPVQISR